MERFGFLELRNALLSTKGRVAPLHHDSKIIERKRYNRALLLSIAFCLILIYFVMVQQMSPPNPHLYQRDAQGAAQAVANSSGHVGLFPVKEKRLPQAIIIGTRKSGTRALLRFLEINPAIKSAPREIHFFDRKANYDLGLEWYRDQMPETSRSEITIEKSPAYFVTGEAPDRIKAMNANIKLILILRNPVTRLISDFSQTIANRLAESPSLLEDRPEHGQLVASDEETTVAPSTSSRNLSLIWRAAEQELRAHLLRPDGGIDEQRRIIRIGMYSTHLERWLAVFSRDQLHLVDGERLVERPHEEVQKVERFLGLTPPVVKRGHFVFSPRKGFFCLANRTLASTPPSSLSSRYRRQAARSNSSDGPVCLGESKGRRHVFVDSGLIDKLRDFYAPYNEYLESMTGLKFNR